MPELTDTVTKQELGDAIQIVCRNRAGVPWNRSNMNQCINRFERLYDHVAPGDKDFLEDQGVMWEDLLSATAIKSFCDGATLHTREQGNRAMSATESYEQTIGTGSISHMVNVAKRLLLNIHENADVDELDMLAEHAEYEAAARRELTNAKVPPFATIVAKVHDYATEILRKEDEDIGLLGLSKLAYTLLQTCILPGRERMLLSLRFAFIEDFTEDEDHAPETLEALKAQHPAAADYLTLATVVIDTHNLSNWKVVVGTKGGQDRKNSFFQSVNLIEPVLAQAGCLRPLLRDTLGRICINVPPGSFVLRSKKTQGEKLLNRNWGNTVFRAVAGVSVGTLRKSVEQCAFTEHLNDPDAMTLEMCTAVCKRCQHRPQTAMTKYVRGGVQKQRARLADTEAVDESEPQGLVRQNAVSDDADVSDTETLDLPETDADAEPDTVEAIEDQVENQETAEEITEEECDDDGPDESGSDSDQDTDANSDYEEECDDDGPGPAVRALIAAFTAAYEQDRAAKRRRTN